MGKLQCIRKCLAGRKWNVGDITTLDFLKSLGVPEVPASFVKYVEADHMLVPDANGDGFETKKEMLNYLMAKGVVVPERTRKDELQKLIDGLPKDSAQTLR